MVGRMDLYPTTMTVTMRAPTRPALGRILAGGPMAPAVWAVAVKKIAVAVAEEDFLVPVRA